MSFEKTQLPDTPVVKQAYEFATKLLDKKTPDTRKRIVDDLHAQIDRQILVIMGTKEVSIKERKQNADNIEKQRDAIIQRNMDEVNKQVGLVRTNTEKKMLERARSFAGQGFANEDNMIAASLMLDAVTTPKEFMDVQAAFPAEIAELLSEVIHATVNRDNIAAVAKDLSDQAKAFMLVDEIGNVKSLKKYVDSMKNKDVTMNRRVIVAGFNACKSLFGVDKKIDDIYIAAFNDFNKTIESGLSLKSENGKVELTATDSLTGFVTKPAAGGKPGKKSVVVDPKGGVKGGKDLF